MSFTNAKWLQLLFDVGFPQGYYDGFLQRKNQLANNVPGAFDALGEYVSALEDFAFR